MRVLVTGGSGFIGRHLIDALVARGAAVCNLDLLAGRSDSRLVHHTVDLMDRPRVCALAAEFMPTHIFNLAANADIFQGGDAFRVNSEGVRNLLAANQALASPAHLIHASTQLVVGPEYKAKNVQDYNPYTAYGESKAESEQILWREGDSSVWTIVRPTTIWGPHHPTFAKTIWRYLAKRWYLLPSGVDPIRSYGHVDNVVYQMLRVAELGREVHARVFYVGDEPIRSSEWLDGFSVALTGKPVRRVPAAFLRAAAAAGEISGRLGGPSPINKGRLYRMSTDYPVQMHETFRVLGRGSMNFSDGIEQTVRWLSTQRGFDKVAARPPTR